MPPGHSNNASDLAVLKEVNSNLKNKTCDCTVGDSCCQRKVSEKKCPSNIYTVFQLGKIESGREYCFGQQ